MKLRIEKKYPYHDTHCGRAPEPYYVFVDKYGKEIGHFEKEQPYHDTHCGRAPKSYYSFVCSDNKESNIYERRIDGKSAQDIEQSNRNKSKTLILRHKR